MAKSVRVTIRRNDFVRIGHEIQAEVDAAVERSAYNIHSRAVEKIMSPPKTGEIYVRRGVPHRASAPGEAPAQDTGNLAADSGVRRLGLAHFAVWFAAAYAAALELGTALIDERPYLRPSVYEEIEILKAAVLAAVRRVR
jgi:hypothetical protein